MKKFDAALTKQNIFMLIHNSGITIEHFANIIDVSTRWVKYIKKGTYDFDIDNIEKACVFFNVDFAKLTTSRLKPRAEYRLYLQKHHKNNTEYRGLLSEKPSIPHVIEFILIKDQEFKQSDGMEIKRIREILEKHELSYSSSSLSNELQKSELIKFYSHPTKKNTNLYKMNA